MSSFRYDKNIRTPLMTYLHIKRHWLQSLALAAVVCLLGGCAGIPKDQLNVYVTQIGEAKRAGETMIADWRSARAELERRESVRSGNAAAANTAPFPLLRKSRLSPPAISAEDARVLAWQAIAAYTATLAELDSGKSVTEVKQAAGQLFELGTRIAGGTLPGGNALVELLKTFASEIEKARLAAEFKKAVKNGAPILQRIIREVLVQDIADHYRLRASLVSVDIASIEFEANLDAKEKQLKRARLVDEFQAFSQSLDRYEEVLVSASAAMEGLVNSTTRTPNFAAEANHALEIALQLKQQWNAYEKARTEGRK